MLRQRFWRWLAVAVVLHGIAGGGAVWAAADTPADSGEYHILPYDYDDGSRPVDDGGTPAPPDRVDSGAAAAAVEEYARVYLADTFGGLYLEGASASHPGTLVITFTQRPTPEHEAALRDLAGGTAITFRIVDYPLADLQQLQREITEAMPELARQGVDVVVIGVDVFTNRVEVTVTGDAEEAEAVLGRRFDAAKLRVVQGSAPQLMPAPAPAAGVEADGAGDSASDTPTQDGDTSDPRPGFWQRLIDAIRSWWRSLFG